MAREIKTKLSADPTNFEKGVKSATDKIKAFGTEIRGQTSVIAKWGAAGIAAATGAGAAIVMMSMKSIDAQAKLARNLDGTTVGLESVLRAAELTGVEFGEMTGASEKLNRALGTAMTNNSSAASKALERLNLNAQDLSKLDIDQRFVAIAERMQEMGLSSQEVAANMRDLGVEQAAIVGLMREGLPALKESREFMERYGTAISGIDSSNVEAANDAMADVQRVSKAAIDQFSAKFAPIIEEISSKLLGTVGDMGGVADASQDMFNAIIKGAEFGVNAVDGLMRTFEVLGKSLAVLGLGFVETGISIAEAITNRPIEAVNELIEAINSLGFVTIEPVGLSEFGESLKSELDIARNAVAIGMQDIEDTLNRPLAGAEFAKFIDDVQKSAMDRYVSNAETAAQKAADAIRSGKQSESEAIAEWDEIINEMVSQQREKKFTDAAEEDAFLTDLIAQGNEKRYQIAAETHAKQKALDDANYEARKAALGNVLDNLSTLMAGKSRKMFEIGKVAAVANTVVSSIQGAQQAYTALSGIPIVGPALGVAAAGAAIAAGAVRVQQINAQSFSKGSVSNAAGAQTAQNIGATASGGQQQQQNIFVQGINKNDLFTGSQLVDLINKGQENGARLVVL